jgi:predicted transcriptional regulator
MRLLDIYVVRSLMRISGAKLAAEAAVSMRELRRIERGDVRPRPETVDALARALAELLRRRISERGGQHGRP